jgi:hypothetical protein
MESESIQDSVRLYQDGDFKMAGYNAPQVLAFLDSDTICVANTVNLAFRKISL